MEIIVTTEHEITIVTVSGRIDSFVASSLESTLLSLIAQGARKIIVNMRSVEYIHSAGVKALLEAKYKIQYSFRQLLQPGDIVISELEPYLEDSLRNVGFHGIFQFFPSNTEALSYLIGLTWYSRF